MTFNRTILDIARVFGGIVSIVFVSIAFDMLARLIERHTLSWQLAGKTTSPIGAARPIR